MAYLVVTASPNPAKVNQTVTFTAQVVGDEPSYYTDFRWYRDGVLVTWTSVPTAQGYFSVPGSYLIHVEGYYEFGGGFAEGDVMLTVVEAPAGAGNLTPLLIVSGVAAAALLLLAASQKG